MKPEKFLENFSTHLKNTIAESIQLANRLRYPEVTPLHLLLAITKETGSVAAELLERTKLETKVILEWMKQHLPRAAAASGAGQFPELNGAAKQALERAMLAAYERKHSYVGTEHLLYGLIASNDEEINAIIHDEKLNAKDLTTEIESVFQHASKFPDIDDLQEVMEQLHDALEEGEPMSAPPVIHAQHAKAKKKNNQPTALEVFTTNLTAKPIAKQLDPVIGREREIERLIHILCRRTKNNPVLVGEPGVGKTAIVEGLARRIAEGDVPAVLRGKKILALDLTLLLAGAIYRGEFEARLKQLVEELKELSDAILFIDEIHNIIGAGSNQGTMDAANILKPALARGQLRCIGATTIDEYKRYVASDPALERRFQPITVEEPSEDETRAILCGLKKYYEAFHGVVITEAAIDAAIRLSRKFIHDNFLPDKAIDLIDEAAAAARVNAPIDSADEASDRLRQALADVNAKKAAAIHEEKFAEATKWKTKIKILEKKLAAAKRTSRARLPPSLPRVTDHDVALVVGRKLNIRPEFVAQNEWGQLKNLHADLSRQIVGQDNVIRDIVETLHHSYFALQAKNRPLASFLFVGPSGVGKTELTKVLARALYHDDKALIKLDMSEFAESHSISKLLGSPAGYVGYRERNRFTDELRQRPYAVLLFDEFDKAHQDVQRLLWQMLDEGELADSTGKKISLRHTIIILTTNIGSELYADSTRLGFTATDSLHLAGHETKRKEVLNRLKEFFSAPLIARLDRVALFRPLSPEDMKNILALRVANLNERLATHGRFAVDPDDAALTTLADEAFAADGGVRQLENLLEHALHGLIAETLQSKKQKKRYTLTKAAKGYKLV